MVNPNSVIPLWVQTFNPEFYTSITDKEDWSYTNQGIGDWQPLFSQLAAALNAYQSFDRSMEVYDFMNSAYSYVILHYNFGTDGSAIPSLDAHNVYSIAGFMGVTEARPIDYYNDLLQPIPPATEVTSPKMTADVAFVNGAPASETASITGIQGISHTVIQGFTNFSLWEDSPRSPTPVGKTFMRTEFFITLHWKDVIQALNINYPIPDPILHPPAPVASPLLPELTTGE